MCVCVSRALLCRWIIEAMKNELKRTSGGTVGPASVEYSRGTTSVEYSRGTTSVEYSRGTTSS